MGWWAGHARLEDLVLGLVQPASLGTGLLPAKAILVTTLRASAPLVLLNVSLGDQAEIEARACGCPLEQLGWTTHLHTIRSYEKVTTGGMAFLDVDVVHVLEEVLPARFGGGPTDYQLVEEEGVDGDPRVLLLVHPSVGPQDPGRVAAAFLEAIEARAPANRVMHSSGAGPAGSVSSVDPRRQRRPERSCISTRVGGRAAHRAGVSRSHRAGPRPSRTPSQAGPPGQPPRPALP